MSIDRAIDRASLEAVESSEGHDAIVVGTGAAGSLATALLTEAGLRVLALDAGWKPGWLERPISRMISSGVRSISNPAALRVLPPGVVWKARQALRVAGRLRQPIQSQCYAWESDPSGFVDDRDNPYETPDDKPFRWVRCRQLGGRMVVPAHGRQYYRHAPFDFFPLDDLSPAWPLEPGELDIWYEKVERQLDLSGQMNGSKWLPDSLISTCKQPTKSQSATIAKLTKRWPDMSPVLGRSAPPAPMLSVAAATNRLLVRTGAIVSGVELSDRGQLKGVRFIDQKTGTQRHARSSLIFLCASALETTRILLLSKSNRFPSGIDAQSRTLGKYIMDHVSVKAEGIGPTLEADSVGPENCIFVPRFDRQSDISTHPTRGYGVRIYQYAGRPGSAYFTAVADAELFPRGDNRVSLSQNCDRWGIPMLNIDCSHGLEERLVAKGQKKALQEIAEILEIKLGPNEISISVPGSSIHECGGARMGSKPENSVVGPNNEVWGVNGLYVTDGASFPSMGIQNPTLTILALTARACADAIARRKS